MKGPRGWQCPKCWKSGKKIKVKTAAGEVDKPPRLTVTDSVKPQTLLQVRYRTCPLCGFNVTTSERIRPDQPKAAKNNKPPQPKHKRG